MVEYCPYCGTPLKETSFGRKWCPNHGIIEDNPKEPDDKNPSYIG